MMPPPVPLDPEQLRPAQVSEWANWLLPGRLMVGGNPAAHGTVDGTKQALIDCHRISLFVCLQSEVPPLSAPEERTQVGYQYFYEADMIAWAAARGLPEPRFLHLPIMDGGIAPDIEVAALAATVVKHMREDEALRVYVHCHGGHGRAGTLAAILLGLLCEDMSPRDALAHVSRAHQSRNSDLIRFFSSPQNLHQTGQVERVLESGVAGTPGLLDDERWKHGFASAAAPAYSSRGRTSSLDRQRG